jgi:hypothetical protein
VVEQAPHDAAIRRRIHRRAHDPDPFHVFDAEPATTVLRGDDAVGVVREARQHRDGMAAALQRHREVEDARLRSADLGMKVMREEQDAHRPS